MSGELVLIAAVTAVLGIAVGRYGGRRALIVTSLVVLGATAFFLYGSHDGMSYLLLVVLNVSLFEIVAVSAMLFFPASR